MQLLLNVYCTTPIHCLDLSKWIYKDSIKPTMALYDALTSICFNSMLLDAEINQHIFYPLKKQARKLQATLVRNYDSLADRSKV